MKVDKSFSFELCCNTNLHIILVLGGGGSDENQGCLKPGYIPLPYGLCLGEVDAVWRGVKRDKISNKNHPTKHQHTVSIQIVTNEKQIKTELTNDKQIKTPDQ